MRRSMTAISRPWAPRGRPSRWSRPVPVPVERRRARLGGGGGGRRAGRAGRARRAGRAGRPAGTGVPVRALRGGLPVDAGGAGRAGRAGRARGRGAGGRRRASRCRSGRRCRASSPRPRTGRRPRPSRRWSRPSRTCPARPSRAGGRATGRPPARRAARPGARIAPGRAGVAAAARVEVGHLAGDPAAPGPTARPRPRRGPRPRATRCRPAAGCSGARSVSAAVTARLIPELSFSSETCRKTMPISAQATSAIHARPRSRRSSQRGVGQRRGRSSSRRPGGRGGPARPAGRPAADGAGPETRRGRARRGAGAQAAGGRRAGVRRGRGHGWSDLSSFRAARSRADFARGLTATSSGEAVTDLRVRSSASGVRPQAHTGRSGGQMHPWARAARNRFTRRSSREWNEIPANRPFPSQKLPGGRQGAIELAELVVDRDPQRPGRCAWPGGRRRSGRGPGSPSVTTSTRRSVVADGRPRPLARDGARDAVGVALLAEVAQDARQAPLLPRVDGVARRSGPASGPCACPAARRGRRRSRGPARRPASRTCRGRGRRRRPGRPRRPAPRARRRRARPGSACGTRPRRRTSRTAPRRRGRGRWRSARPSGPRRSATRRA